MTEGEEWVLTAMSDDSVVVDLLLRLHQAEPPPAPPTTKHGAATVHQLEWTVRQRRSRQQVSRKKGDESTRASPATPLSWSGASSFSGGGGATDGGFEESSELLRSIENARSKVVATGETCTAKRSRKKKSLAALREEESFLLEERRNLKNKMAMVCLSFEKQRAENEILKRVKLDVLSQQTTETVRDSPDHGAILNQAYQMKVLCDPSCMVLPTNGPCNEVKPYTLHGPSEFREGGSKGSSFLLPDLNLPVDDDSCSRNLNGVT